MGHNMMTTQKWYEHITNVIIGNTANFNNGCLDSIDYVDEKKAFRLQLCNIFSWTLELRLPMPIYLNMILRNSSNMLMLQESWEFC